MADLVLALDLTGREEALRTARVCAPALDAIKVGYPLVLWAGPGIAGELRPLGLPLVADFKVADIPATNTLIAEAAFEAGFDAIICQGFPGPDSVRACVESAHSHGGRCFVVAEMSHPGATAFFSGGVPEKITGMARECGADGIIAPATRPDRIRALRKMGGEGMLVWSPGVGVQGGDARAVADLVDGVIVGRAITAAPDPAAQARYFARLCQ